jgi:hypothetical protein
VFIEDSEEEGRAGGIEILTKPQLEKFSINNKTLKGFAKAPCRIPTTSVLVGQKLENL